MKNLFAFLFLAVALSAQTVNKNVQKVTDGTNAITESLVIGSGKSLSASGSGTITATAVPYSGITGLPTTLSGYGITDPVALTLGSYVDPSWLTSLSASKLTLGTLPDARLNTNLTGITSITAPAATNLTLNAGSGSQNVNVAPTGTGSVLLGKTTVNGTSNANTILIQSGLTASQAYGLRIMAGTNSTDYAMRVTTADDVSPLFRVNGNGSILLGTATDSANGRLQLASHTTSTGGIGFGTDATIYRSAAGTLTFGATTASTSTTTGALVVGSNVGLSGNAGGPSYFGGPIALGTGTDETFYKVATNTLAIGTSRPISFNGNGGTMTFKASAGGWSMGTLFTGSAGTIDGGIWGAGNSDALSNIKIGAGAFASPWLDVSDGNTQIFKTSTGTTSFAAKAFDATSNAGHRSLDSAGGRHTEMYYTASGVYGAGAGDTVINENSGNMVFSTNDIKRMSIAASTGNVAITSTTSASTSLLGAVVVGNGTAATSVGIGGGNIFAGGSITAGATIASGTGLFTATTGNNTIIGTNGGTTALTLTTTGITAAAPIVHKSYTVASLPAASSTPYGIVGVSDATNAAGTGLGTAPTGGGSVKRMVYSDGTSWLLL